MAKKHKKKTKTTTQSHLLQKKEENIKKNTSRKSYFILIPIFVILGFTITYFTLLTHKNKVKRESNLNILLITIDTIRADRVGYSGYDIDTPNLDSLAYKGVRFMNAVCQVPVTLPSHASILTGTNPPFHLLKDNGTYYLLEDFTTLAEVLKNNGYLTAAFVGAFPLDSQYGLNQGFDVYDDTYDTPINLKKHGPQRIAKDVNNVAIKWLKLNYDKNFFVWVHYYDPHVPYSPPPPFDTKYKSRAYDGEIAYTDVYVGKLIEFLAKKRVFNRTLVVVVGDHGEGLGDHKESTHGFFIYDDTLKVPLIFHCSNIIPKRIEIKRQVRTVDIFPTILDILKIEIPPYCQGASLIPVINGKKIEEAEESYAETYGPLLSGGWSELKAIRTPKWKYIQAPKPELYDIENDAQELNNLVKQEKNVALELRKRLEKLEKRISFKGKGSATRELTQEEKEKLMALGYISSLTNLNIARKSREDPKDKIHVFEKLGRANIAILKEDFELGEKILKEIIREDPENPSVHHFLGTLYQRKKQWDKAIEEFKKAVKGNETNLGSRYQLALSYYNKGMKKESIREAQAILSLNERHFNSLNLLIEIYNSSKDYKHMMSYLEKATELRPEDSDLRFKYAKALVFSKENDKAIKELEFLLAKMPDNPTVYNNLGIAYFHKNDLERAIKYLSLEVEFNSNPRSFLLLGQIYGKLGKYSEAVDNLEKYLAYAPAKDPRRQKAEATLQFYRSQIK